MSEDFNVHVDVEREALHDWLNEREPPERPSEELSWEADPLVQYLCRDCGRYSRPSGFGEVIQPGMVEAHVEGCWVTTGYSCPECAGEGT